MPNRSMTGERAAILPGELEILGALVDNLPEIARWMVYADWLEERGDPRGSFLQSFVAACQSGTVLPDSAAFPQSWRNVVGVTLIEGAVQYRLYDRIIELLATARPTIAFSTEPASDQDFPVGGTKHAGCPDLPGIEYWPTWKGGPLGFVAQFQLADFAGTLAGRELPSSGLLSFFVFSDTEGGLPLPESECWRVLYFPNGTNLRRCPPHQDLDKSNQVRPAFSVSFAETLDLPWSRSAEYQQLGLGDRDVEYDLVEQMLGFKLRHLFGHGHYPTLGQAPFSDGEWRHFITFDSDSPLGCGWDWGEWNFIIHIRERDLQNKRFDRTQVIVN